MKKLLVGTAAAAMLLGGAGAATATPSLEVTDNSTSAVREYSSAHGPFNNAWTCNATRVWMNKIAISGCYKSGGKWWFNII